MSRRRHRAHRAVISLVQMSVIVSVSMFVHCLFIHIDMKSAIVIMCFHYVHIDMLQMSVIMHIRQDCIDTGLIQIITR
jgi:hypothetical protein